MEAKYAYNDDRVNEYKQYIPENELIQQGYTNKFLLDVVKCIMKTLHRLSTLALMNETEHTNRILESKLDRCLKELQYFMLNLCTFKTPIVLPEIAKGDFSDTNDVFISDKVTVTSHIQTRRPNGSAFRICKGVKQESGNKHEAKANIIEILNILCNHVDSVARAKRANRENASSAGHISERLSTIIANIKANNYRRVLYPPPLLTFAERMYRQPTEYEQNAQRFSEMHTLSRLPTMRDLAPEFRANIESYLAPAGYDNSGTKRYDIHLAKTRSSASTLGKRTTNKESSKKSNKTRKTK